MQLSWYEGSSWGAKIGKKGFEETLVIWLARFADTTWDLLKTTLKGA
jgi:hypothetical protein